MTRVLIWDERTAPAEVYPEGIGGCIASGLEGCQTRLACLEDPDQGVSEDALSGSDVLIWWGHKRHRELAEANAERVVRHVVDRGMGFLALHSAHKSKPFLMLQGTDGELGGWREDAKPERIYTIEPNHPIAQGLPPVWELAEEEMYAERFSIRPPDDLIFLSTFAGGEVFRSGCCWRLARGRMFYFRPGHETHRTYFDSNVRRVIQNAVGWCACR